MRKWFKRYQNEGIKGLTDLSKKPLSSPKKKVDDQIIEWILELRNSRNLGVRRIQSELFRLYDCSLSLATIHKVLIAQKAKPIKRLKRKKKFHRYQRPIPGDRIQIDYLQDSPRNLPIFSCNCSRWRVLELYKRRTANNTLDFIDVMVEQFPFPIQRIQSDRGREFFAYKVQEKLMAYSIKFRPIKPRSPHLNGKVERSQKTDLEEFYATTDLSKFEVLKDELKSWQFFYNWQNPHGSLEGKTPSQYSSELGNKTPFWDEVIAAYDYDPKKNISKNKIITLK